MLTVVDCLTRTHDPWLVGLAAGICILATSAAVELLHHAHRAPSHRRALWIAVAAVAGGSGIWATHFVAMMAYEPKLPSGYDIALTLLSLVSAVTLTGLSLGVALVRSIRSAPALGGAILGGGIAAMHYTGMAAYRIAGHIAWDPALVVASLAIGVALPCAALQVARSGRGLGVRVAGAFLLLLGICGHHFTAMAAVTIVPDPRIVIPDGVLPARWLAGGIALASATILLLAGAALVLDVRERRHAQVARERARLRSLANAAVEGLLICCGDRIVTANDSFGAIVDGGALDLAGLPLSRFLPDADRHLVDQPGRPIETDLVQAGGDLIPVELVMRSVAYGDEPHYAVAVRDLRARRKAEREVQFLAHHDGLTGLANRASFTRRLEQELKHARMCGQKVAVLYLDLDRFKEVNDLFGHASGDTLLTTVARTLSDLADENDLMARLGGDEFAVLMRCEHPAAAGRLAERIQEALSNQSTEFFPAVAASIGIALFPDDASDPVLLLSYADAALYRAKAEERGSHRYFEAGMGARMRERRLLEHDLRHAVARGEMQLVFQPQTQVGTGTVIGFEALLRWHHPTRGTVPPSLFIPIAEETGAILPIGEWVLAQACREAVGWAVPLSIAVNVSGVQIHAPHFVQTVADVLRETGLRAERLEIEITETALIRDPARAASALKQLKALGIRLAMDDFGTGYSSLSNLRSYPFDKIKIDGSFVRSVDSNAQTATIVRSVLGLGRGLGLPVLAEGVETEAELRFLMDEQCYAAQGYLMGRPARIETFAEHTQGPRAGTANREAA